MTWAADRDQALTDATAAGTALAALYTSGKTALITAQNGSGTGTDASNWESWKSALRANLIAALVAGGVSPDQLDELLGKLRAR